MFPPAPYGVRILPLTILLTLAFLASCSLLHSLAVATGITADTQEAATAALKADNATREYLSSFLAGAVTGLFGGAGAPKATRGIRAILAKRKADRAARSSFQKASGGSQASPISR